MRRVMVAASVSFLLSGLMAPAEPAVVLARQGKPVVKIMAASTGGVACIGYAAPAVEDLCRVLDKMTGATFERVAAPLPDALPPGLYVGRLEDFGGTDLRPLLPKALDKQAFVIRTTDKGHVLLVGGDDWGVSHAIYEMLYGLGCRWYYPGADWEIVPRVASPAVSGGVTGKPDFHLQRRIWVGAGLHSAAIKRDYGDWMRRNRMGSPVRVHTSHSWIGLNNQKDFQEHPEWFGLVAGERKASKPCYSHPEVIARAKAYALAAFEKNPDADMISVSPPDGLNYCTCERCQKVSKVVKTYEAHGTTFGTTADGREVSLASETLFALANEVARAVAAQYPDKYLGILAYSAYAHPPTFPLEPNIYVEITRGYRRTPLTQGEQIAQFAEKGHLLGVYEYFDVIQWSWDQPGSARAARLNYLAGCMSYYYRNNMRSLNGEMSYNFGPNGVGYYMIGRLLWKHDADVRALEEEFYRLAFGPAAESVKRMYRRWESGQKLDERTLALTYRDLAEASRLTAGQPESHARVDYLRMYARFLKLFLKPQQFSSKPKGKPALEAAAAALYEKYGKDEALRRAEELGLWGSRLMDTAMIHTYGFNRCWAVLGREMGIESADTWARPSPPPSADEIETLFKADLATLDVEKAMDVSVQVWSRDLVPVQSDPLVRMPKVEGGIVMNPRTATLVIPVEDGQPVEVQVAAGIEQPVAFFVSQLDFLDDVGSLSRQRCKVVAFEKGVLRVAAPEKGCLEVTVTGTPVRVSQPCLLKDMRILDGRLYFLVQRGCKRFLVRAAVADGATLVVRDASDKVVLNVSRDPAREWFVDVPAGSDHAVWSITGPGNVNGKSGITLIGVPGDLSLLPDLLLAPREALTKK